MQPPGVPQAPGPGLTPVPPWLKLGPIISQGGLENAPRRIRVRGSKKSTAPARRGLGLPLPGLRLRALHCQAALHLPLLRGSAAHRGQGFRPAQEALRSPVAAGVRPAAHAQHPGPQGHLPLRRAAGPGDPPGQRALPGRGSHPPGGGQRPTQGRAGRGLLLQERRPKPLGLFQGPGHGRGAQLHQLPGQAPGGGRDTQCVRLHRRHLGRGGALRLLSGPGGEKRGAPAPGQGDPGSSSASPWAPGRGFWRSPACSTTA